MYTYSNSLRNKLEIIIKFIVIICLVGLLGKAVEGTISWIIKK